VKENRRVTVNEIAAHLDMSQWSAHDRPWSAVPQIFNIQEINKYLSFKFGSHLYDEANSILCETDLLTSLKEVYFRDIKFQ
jgi:hypothetical protein